MVFIRYEYSCVLNIGLRTFCNARFIQEDRLVLESIKSLAQVNEELKNL